MTDAVLTAGRIRGGAWHAVLRGGAEMPRVEVLQGAVVLPGLTLAAVADAPGDWAVRVPIPVEMLTDGVVTFLLRPTGTANVLGHFTLICGVAMEEDIRAELDLLRAELDMLKRAFRRHCVDTM